ncbi:MAG: trypsin-like peptidase domain-containing protein [Thermoplasmatales archaeon]|nr:trypsin-like peptidase domain-containing protein [Thermoplasmatales archaeon]
MFANACERAMKFTRPVITSVRTADGAVSSSCGAFVVINREGWIVTAGHIFDSFVQFRNDFEKNKDRKDKSTHVGLTNHSFWWGADGAVLENVYVNREIDVAFGKLKGFRPEAVREYPEFKVPDNVRPGTSLCRIGFPFVGSNTEFNEKTNSFVIPPGMLPIPFFPNDCIHTRNLLAGRSKDGNHEMLYIETSAPGLRGQSGGPIFDRSGRIAGIQVRTMHLPLGFRPEVATEGGTVVENQFMNVGVGVHVKTLISVMDALGIRYASEADDDGYRIVG